MNIKIKTSTNKIVLQGNSDEILNILDDIDIAELIKLITKNDITETITKKGK